MNDSSSRRRAPFAIAACAVYLLTVPAASALAQFSEPKTDHAATAPKEQTIPSRPAGRFEVAEKPDRLLISHAGTPLTEFVFRDPKILRPFFANVRTLGGLQATRNHPPLQGVDAADHDAMHPGIWLAFGDISGVDFWRNQGRIEHLRFSEPPTVNDDRLAFATESRLKTPDGRALCLLTSRIVLAARSAGWLLVWDATFRSDDGEFAFGDQEEMGFGARVATPLTEKNGGLIVNSAGQQTAATTWGQAAAWCDYSGLVDRRRVGMTLMAADSNFRPSWWHNRDYGVFVANPFGRAAMKQGERSAVAVKRGEAFRLRFAAFIHDATNYDPAITYRDYVSGLADERL